MISTPPPKSPDTINQKPSEVERLARAIEGAGMKDVAAVMLRIIKPLSWVGGQMMWMFQPFFSGFGKGRGGPLSTASMAEFLEHDKNIDELVKRLSEQ